MCLASGNKKNLQYWFPFGPDEWVNRAPNARTNSNSNVVRLLFFSRENRKCFYSLTEFFVPHFLLVVFCLVDSLTQALISLEIYEEQERKKEKKKLPGEKGRRRRNQKLEEFIKTIGERTVPFYCFLMMTSLVEKKSEREIVLRNSRDQSGPSDDAVHYPQNVGMSERYDHDIRESQVCRPAGRQ